MRIYTGVIDQAALTDAHQIAKLLVPADMIVGVLGVRVTSDVEAADAWDIQIGRATGGGTASPVTCQKADAGDAANSALLYDITGDTEASSFLEFEGMIGDPRAGFYFQRAPTLEDPLWLSPSSVFVVNSSIAVTSMTLKCVVTFVEMGG
jgi:hypothetical protein